MAISEKFCLKWNDYKENVNHAFAGLGKDSEFADVTLACQDGHQIEAHKVILAASSPFFQNLFKRIKHSHPLIYMKGMKSEDVSSIVDFLYYGEANIYQENLDTFLNIAEELELKGLKARTGEGGGVENPLRNADPSVYSMKENYMNEDNVATRHNAFLSKQDSEDHINSSMVVALPKQEFSGDITELDQKIETMITRGENMVEGLQKRMIKAFVCQVCGKEAGQKINMKDHIEAYHLEGISIPCNICEKTFRSRKSFRHHNYRFHTIRNQSLF